MSGDEAHCLEHKLQDEDTFNEKAAIVDNPETHDDPQSQENSSCRAEETDEGKEKATDLSNDTNEEAVTEEGASKIGESVQAEQIPETEEDGKSVEPSTEPTDVDLQLETQQQQQQQQQPESHNPEVEEDVSPRRVQPRREASRISSQQDDSSMNNISKTPGSDRKLKKIPYQGDINLLEKDKYGRYRLPPVPPPVEGYTWNRIDATWMPGKRAKSRRRRRYAGAGAEESKEQMDSSTHISALPNNLKIIPFDGDIETLEKDAYGRYLVPGPPPVDGYTWNRINATWVPGRRALYANNNMDSGTDLEAKDVAKQQTRKRNRESDIGQESSDSESEEISYLAEQEKVALQNNEVSSAVDVNIPMGTSGRFLRPGSPPIRGYRWDREAGFWVPGLNGIIALKDDVMPMTPAEKSKITNWAGQRIDPSTFIPHDGPLLKDKTGKRFLRPGTPPKPGYTWERYMGGWVPGILTNSGTPTDANSDEIKSSKRNRNSRTKIYEGDSDVLESSNCIEPRSALRMEYGNYLVPEEGPPQSGATWDRKHGVWIKDISKFDSREAAVFAARVAHRRGIQHCGDWVAPKEKPILSKTGEIYIRPVEKPPAPHYHWNRYIGVWVPGSLSKFDKTDGSFVDLSDNNGSRSYLEEDSMSEGTESLPGSRSSRRRTPKRSGTEGIDWIAPDISTLKVGSNGRYCLRPDGDPPKPEFCVWDGHQAAWVKKEKPREKRRQPNEHGKRPSSNKITTDDPVEGGHAVDVESDQGQPQERLFTPIRHGVEGIDWFAPSDFSALKVGSNGRYFLRPQGDPPKPGLYWDGYQGAWVKKPVMCQGRRGSGISSLGNEAELEAKTSQTPDAKAESSTTGNHSDSSVAGSRPNTPGIVTRTARRADQVVDSTAWLQPEFPPAVVDGKFIRPKGNAPIEGYVWCSKKGVWIPGRKLIGVVPNAEIAERWESRIKRKLSRRDRASTLKNMGADGRKEKRTSVELSSDLKHGVETISASNRKIHKLGEMGEPTISLDLTVTYGPAIPSTQDERNEKILAPAHDLYHPDSKWQEPNPSIPQPTLYEKHRNPRPAPSGTVVCSLKALQQEFRCVICLGYIQNARLVVQCNHRFCGDCIERLLSQVGQRKECPICRTHIPSRRSLAPDPSFDRLIHKILPRELIVSEIDEEHVVTQNLNVENKNLQKAIELKKQAEVLRKSQIAEGTPETATEPSELTLQPNFTPPLIKIELILREKDGLMQVEPLRMPFVTISGDATILVLKSFIVQKYGFLSRKVQIWSILDSRPTPLEDAMSLHFVATHWADEYFGNYVPLYYGFE